MRYFNVLVYFLDADLSKSAQYLTNRFLDLQIKNCCQILVCSLMYIMGIRNSRMHKYYFSKEHKKESMDKFFPFWPMKNSPSFMKYNSQESRWCRKCKNHYDYILEYFEMLLNEYCYRHGHDHELYEMLDYLKMEQYNISIRMGIKVVYIDNLKIVLPWKSLPLKYRKKDLIKGYREFYASQILDPIIEYASSKRDIPEFITKRYEYLDA